MDVDLERRLLPPPGGELKQELREHAFDCPYCGESITMLLDLTASPQRYVEDCEVCCSPIEVGFGVDDDGAVTSFQAAVTE